MLKEKIEPFLLNKNVIVDVIEMGDIIKVRYISRKNTQARIKKIDNDNFINLSTGEICFFEHNDNRKENISFLRSTFENLRCIINSNVTLENQNNCLWCTLTYAENMTDSVRLYKDFEKFIKRLKYYYHKKNISFEYITVAEPQKRGAWHMHLILLFEKPVFLPNSLLAEKWEQGFVKVNKIPVSCDNLGAYVSAYLCDLEIEENAVVDFNSKLKIIDDRIEKHKKSFVKGGRLSLYPSGFNIYRCSRGIKRPVKTMCTYEEAQKKISNGVLTYSSYNKLIDTESDFETLIVNEYYNKARLKKSICDNLSVV